MQSNRLNDAQVSPRLVLKLTLSWHLFVVGFLVGEIDGIEDTEGIAETDVVAEIVDKLDGGFV